MRDRMRGPIYNITTVIGVNSPEPNVLRQTKETRIHFPYFSE